MFVTLEIARHSLPNAISVPSEAIIPEMGRSIIYLYKNGTAQATEILLGLRGERRVQVLKGLVAGDTVLVSGVMQLRSGITVAIDNFK